MFNFAVVKDGQIDNLIIADSKDIAEELTGMECIQYDILSILPQCGWSVVDGEIINPNPIVDNNIEYSEEDYANMTFIEHDDSLDDPNNPNNPNK